MLFLKKVTIMHAQDKLLNQAYPDKFRKDLERRIRVNDIQLILDDYVDSFPASAARKGVPLGADFVVAARVPTPPSLLPRSGKTPLQNGTPRVAIARVDFPHGGLQAGVKRAWTYDG